MNNHSETARLYIYEIRVKEIVDPHWDWPGGFTATHPNPDETLFSGTIVDQAALHGILARIRDLNLTLLSVEQIKLEDSRKEISMSTTQSVSRSKFWKIALLYGVVHFLVMTYGAFVIEQADCQFVIPAYFMTLPAMLSILTLRRFGAGTVVFLPYAILGFYPVYYMDYLTLHTMTSVWGAVAWCLGGLLTGLAGDLAFRFLPSRIPERWHAILIGVVIGLGIYLTPLIAMTYFYISQPSESHYYMFTTRIAYSLSWLLVNGGFAGYTAYAIQKQV